MVVVENLPPLQPNTAAIIKQQQQQKQRQSHHHQQKQQQQSKDLLCNSFIVRCWNGKTCRYCAEYCQKGVQERCRFPSTQAQTHAHACQNGGAILYRSQEKIVSIFQASVFVCVCVCVGANVSMCVCCEAKKHLHVRVKSLIFIVLLIWLPHRLKNEQTNHSVVAWGVAHSNYYNTRLYVLFYTEKFTAFSPNRKKNQLRISYQNCTQMPHSWFECTHTQLPHPYSSARTFSQHDTNWNCNTSNTHFQLR